MATRKKDDSAATMTERGARRGRSSQRDDHYPRLQRDEDRADASHPADAPHPADASHPADAPHPAAAAHEHYRHEKARRERSQTESADPLADAKREYKALLAAEAARGKGGRPRKNAAKTAAKQAAPAAADELEGEEPEVEGLESEELEVEIEGDAETHAEAAGEAAERKKD